MERCHALGVVVQVHEQGFEKGIDWTGLRWRRVQGEELRLFFEGRHEGGKFGDDACVAGGVEGGSGGEDEGEGEDEFIAVVARGG